MTNAESASKLDAEVATYLDREHEALQASDQEPLGPWRDRFLNLKAVRWGITVNTGNYSSVRLDAESQVGEDNDVEATLAALKSWVLSHAPPSAADIADREKDYSDLRYQVDQVDARLREARLKWNAVTTVFERLGIAIPEQYVEDLPF